MKYHKIYKYLLDMICNVKYEEYVLKEAKEKLTKKEYEKLLYELNEARKNKEYD